MDTFLTKNWIKTTHRQLSPARRFAAPRGNIGNPLLSEGGAAEGIFVGQQWTARQQHFSHRVGGA